MCHLKKAPLWTETFSNMLLEIAERKVDKKKTKKQLINSS